MILSSICNTSALESFFFLVVVGQMLNEGLEQSTQSKSLKVSEFDAQNKLFEFIGDAQQQW